MNASWFLTEIKALVHALATKGNEYYRIVSVVYVRLKCVPLCISFAYPLAENSDANNPAPKPYLGFNKSEPYDGFPEQCLPFIQYISAKKKDYACFLAYVVCTLCHSSKCSAGVLHLFILMEIWLISFTS